MGPVKGFLSYIILSYMNICALFADCDYALNLPAILTKTLK